MTPVGVCGRVARVGVGHSLKGNSHASKQGLISFLKQPDIHTTSITHTLVLLGGGGGRVVSVCAEEWQERRGEEAEGKVDYLGGAERRAGSTPQAP